MNILERVNIASYTTFGFPSTAQYVVHIESVDGLRELLSHAIYQQEKSLILGGGSNIIFDGDYNGLIIHMNIKGIRIVDQNDEYITLRVGAGEDWHDLVMYTVAEGWGGIENLALIPGTVGAAPVQNIGAYGVEISEHIVAVEVIDRTTGEEKTLTPSECAFGYRSSIFKTSHRDQYIITHVHVRLTKKGHIVRTDYGDIKNILEQKSITRPHMSDVCDAVIAIRQSKLPDPSFIGNAGSFFKNPIVDASVAMALSQDYPTMPSYEQPDGRIKIPAGWLIEQAGWKGRRRGSVGVHEKQALVLVHFGGGASSELISLANDIVHDIQEQFNITLEPEVTIIRS